MRKTYFTADDSELLTDAELFYMVKNYQLVEIVLKNDLYVRMWKDIPMTYDTPKANYQMDYGTVYLTDGNTILDVRHGRGEDVFSKRLRKCEKLKYDWNLYYNEMQEK